MSGLLSARLTDMQTSRLSQVTLFSLQTHRPEAFVWFGGRSAIMISFFDLETLVHLLFILRNMNIILH